MELAACKRYKKACKLQVVFFSQSFLGDGFGGGFGFGFISWGFGGGFGDGFGDGFGGGFSSGFGGDGFGNVTFVTC